MNCKLCCKYFMHSLNGCIFLYFGRWPSTSKRTEIYTEPNENDHVDWPWRPSNRHDNPNMSATLFCLQWRRGIHMAKYFFQRNLSLAISFVGYDNDFKNRLSGQYPHKTAGGLTLKFLKYIT